MISLMINDNRPRGDRKLCEVSTASGSDDWFIIGGGGICKSKIQVLLVEWNSNSVFPPRNTLN